MAAVYFAHTPGDKNHQPVPADWQPLAEHLTAVARLGNRFAREARPFLTTDADECRQEKQAVHEGAFWAGLLHDLGKYRPEFQQMLRGQHPKNEHTRHKQAGAAFAYQQGRADLAFVIAGHHGGLPDPAQLKDLIASPGGRDVAAQVEPLAKDDCPALNQPFPKWRPVNDPLHFDLLVRFLFSCLVDADWQDTGAYQRKVANLPPEAVPPDLEPGPALQKVLAYIRERARACPDPRMAGIRQEILDAALAAADLPPGLFSFTVPTGGGKTLSALAFALAHAFRHDLRRVIYVAPYLSIIDQNARVIREALGVGKDSPAVFEHHSLAEPPGDEDENETAREAAVRRAENWDAPVIITTSVQFFESLFSNKPGRCRKIHNIARSVVVLDECQTLPPELVAPTCSMLKQTAADLGASIVLCTATQPAFDHPDMPERLERVHEIIPEDLRRRDDRDLFVRLRRVQVRWPKKGDAVLDWPEVASRMCAAKQALCIVNTRRAARELLAELKPSGDGVFHLSTSMCPAHRLAVLDEVRKRLSNRQSCYLVSTQLIEAGVDVDFPFVMRELAPLEAIIQSAGRCNREGLLNGSDGSPGGRVMVFRSTEGRLPPDRWYKAGRAVLETSFLNNNREPRIDDPADTNEYFERLYRTGNLDGQGIQDARKQFQFATVSENYRLIEDDGVAVVVASWEERREEVEALIAAVRHCPIRRNFRKLAPFQVNLRRYELAKAGGSVGEEGSGVLVWHGGYDADLGLTAENVDTLLLV